MIIINKKIQIFEESVIRGSTSDYTVVTVGIKEGKGGLKGLAVAIIGNPAPYNYNPL